MRSRRASAITSSRVATGDAGERRWWSPALACRWCCQSPRLLFWRTTWRQRSGAANAGCMRCLASCSRNAWLTGCAHPGPPLARAIPPAGYRLPACISEVQGSLPRVTIVDKQRLLSVGILEIADVLIGMQVIYFVGGVPAAAECRFRTCSSMASAPWVWFTDLSDQRSRHPPALTPPLPAGG